MERYNTSASIELMSHIAIVPPCVFNSYDIQNKQSYQTASKGLRSQYVMGDFLIHFAGENTNKASLLKKYLNDSRQHNSY